MEISITDLERKLQSLTNINYVLSVVALVVTFGILAAIGFLKASDLQVILFFILFVVLSLICIITGIVSHLHSKVSKKIAELTKIVH